MYLEDYGTYFRISVRIGYKYAYIKNIYNVRDLRDVLVKEVEEANFYICKNGKIIPSSYLLFTKKLTGSTVSIDSIVIPNDLTEELLIQKIKSRYPFYWKAHKIFIEMVEV